MKENFLGNRTSIDVSAFCIGERVDIRNLADFERLAVSPLTIGLGRQGCAVILRYGAAVLFGLEPEEEQAFLKHLRTMVREPFSEMRTEEATLMVNPVEKERVDAGGLILLQDLSVEKLQIIADILAKSVVLEYYEENIARIFDRIEPLAAGLQRRGLGTYRNKELLTHIGSALLIQHKMVGRVEVTEKPDVLWERPDLERLYVRLEGEYELQERHLALERKLELIGHTAQTIIDLIEAKRTLRVEWYIVILILVEIILTLYEMFIR